jgi:hypothetical protein
VGFCPPDDPLTTLEEYPRWEAIAGQLPELVGRFRRGGTPYELSTCALPVRVAWWHQACYLAAWPDWGGEVLP